MNEQFKISPNEISVPVFLSERKGYWIAYCPVLKLYGYSKESGDAAYKDFDKAIITFFHVQNTLGTLNQTLLNLGWTRDDGRVSAPQVVSYFNLFELNL
jgi:hypothetical protein